MRYKGAKNEMPKPSGGGGEWEGCHPLQSTMACGGTSDGLPSGQKSMIVTESFW